MSNVKAVKLAGSGEELVVEIVSETAATIEFKNPVACVMQRGEQGPMLGFMPWMQAANGPFMINRDKILLIAEVADEVEIGYNRIFGAGIVVPPKQLIMG
jgi:hypothetical protein